MEVGLQQVSEPQNPKFPTPHHPPPCPPLLPPRAVREPCSLAPQHRGYVPSLFLPPTSFLIRPVLLASPGSDNPLPTSCSPPSPQGLGMG